MQYGTRGDQKDWGGRYQLAVKWQRACIDRPSPPWIQKPATSSPCLQHRLHTPTHGTDHSWYVTHYLFNNNGYSAGGTETVQVTPLRRTLVSSP